MTPLILVIDDEPDIRELIEITLGRMKLATRSAGTLAEARQLLLKHEFQLCLTDMKLPDGDGLALVAEIQIQYPQLPVAVITAFGSTDTAITALKSGAFDFVSKPVDLMKLRTLVSSAIKLSTSLPVDATEIPESLLIGAAPGIQMLKQQISKLARSQAPVFISGESGSGKELVARSIHREGPRKDKPFIAINCGAVPEHLMESEFFGHKKGSFTGADQDKIGLFQAAHGGSLFLDEVAELPLHMQVKLLRSIQEKSIRPIGAQQELPVDIRLISASHKNLGQQVDAGNMRQDFYYRINVIELQVPPLRDRLEDLPLLVEHLLRKFSPDSGTSPFRLTSEALQVLQGYNFPGNVRELENLLQRACALSEGTSLTADEFTDLLEVSGPTDPVPDFSLHPPKTAGSKSPGFSLEKHLEDIERKEIEKALLECRWNKTAAAKKLGMSFRSFRYRLKKLEME